MQTRGKNSVIVLFFLILFFNKHLCSAYSVKDPILSAE